MDTMSKIIYDDIFEAIRHVQPNNIFLEVKDRGNLIKQNQVYELMNMQDGTMRLLPHNMFGNYYRGENEEYKNCIPSIYRNNQSKVKILVDEIKIKDFENIAKTFPQVKYAIKDCCHVDYTALAQHYELNTNMIDVTCEIGIAAFFATHKYNKCNKDYKTVKSGIGVIRGYDNYTHEIDNFHVIGLQPFQRPGLQSAFGIKLKQNEDFSTMGWTVYFKQSPQYNDYIHQVFYKSNNENSLLPNEEIANVAQIIKKNPAVTKEGLTKYCEEKTYKVSDVEKVLIRNKIRILDEPLYVLSKDVKDRLSKQFKGKPYGDVKISASLFYIQP